MTPKTLLLTILESVYTHYTSLVPCPQASGHKKAQTEPVETSPTQATTGPQ